MRTILITGSTGFLGKHLVRLLLKRESDARLRLLCRGDGLKDDSGLDDDRVEIVPGDIRNRDQVLAAAAGVDSIYHLAGFVDRSPTDPWPLYDTHVEGTRNVCEAMLKCSTRKAVFVSTSGVAAVGAEPVERDETAPYAQDLVWEWPYYLSKMYAEKLALGYVKHRKLPIVHINPSLLLGPGDDRGSSTRDVELFLKGEIVVTPIGGLNLVDVRDAALGAVLAMEKGRVGERYLLGGPNLTFHEWTHRASRLSGVSAPKLMVPLKLSLLGAKILRAVYPLFGRRYELDDASIKMSALYWYCDSSKARKELGFETREPDETLRATIEYLRNRPAA